MGLIYIQPMQTFIQLSRDLPGPEACKFWGVGVQRRERRMRGKWVGEGGGGRQEKEGEEEGKEEGKEEDMSLHVSLRGPHTLG